MEDGRGYDISAPSRLKVRLLQVKAMSKVDKVFDFHFEVEK